MKYYSTKDKNHRVSLRDAVLKSLPPDNGLYMPEKIPVLPESFFSQSPSKSFQEISFEISNAFLKEDLPESVLREIIDQVLTFDAPLIEIEPGTFILELFHGPTLAFKDFGARFMARLMAYLNRGENQKLTILVATSGDTGSAVASGFFEVEGIEVIVLYPSGKVSPLQEKQLTVMGGNIHAIEIKGTFDDCQRMVKTAFLDQELNRTYRLSSANSINIARLIPQSFYYVYACSRIPGQGPPVISVPSGNFGNLTAGMMAKKIGLPVRNFIAATNINDVVPSYLEDGKFIPRDSVPTISNAMDVGNPSNFFRMVDLYDGSLSKLKADLTGYSISDKATRETIRGVYLRTGYILDPHGAVGYCALKNFKSETGSSDPAIILETAHPAKFIDVVEAELKVKIQLPEQLEKVKNLPKKSDLMDAYFDKLKEYLLAR